MNAKPIKIDDRTRYYRGFSIVRNYISEHGTGRVCDTQRGWRMIPGGKAEGDWKPSINDAVEYIDMLYSRYDTLSRQGKYIVDQAILIAKVRGDETQGANS